MRRLRASEIGVVFVLAEVFALAACSTASELGPGPVDGSADAPPPLDAAHEAGDAGRDGDVVLDAGADVHDAGHDGGGGADAALDAGADVQTSADAAADANDAAADANDAAADADAQTDAAASDYGTFISLGDSISTASPSFHSLLVHNDDATYPAWHGKDLATRYPGIAYVTAAVAGAVSGAYADGLTNGASYFTGQVSALGHAYAGNVLVAVTIGGNDLRAHLYAAIDGTDAADRTQLTANLNAALDELTSPGRLGSGSVRVVVTNIYDASDGQGDFAARGCPYPTVSSALDQQAFANWNGAMADAFAGRAAVTPFDLHALFLGHGAGTSGNFFLSDCTHPNADGHAAMRAELWRLVTGEVVP